MPLLQRTITAFALALPFCISAAEPAPSIPFIDLADDHYRQILVDHEAGQYLGHPTTCLLDDGKTILTVYPKGHGKGGIVYKRSTDGGLTWSDRLPTPHSWLSSREVPTLHRVTDAAGKKRIIMFSGLYPIRMSISEDDGATWSELESIGDFGGIVAMGCHFPVKTKPGHYICLFHDDGRFIHKDSKKEKLPVMTLFKTLSSDGGLSWGQPEKIFGSPDIHLCEPGVIRSPDGKSLAVLLRENRRKKTHTSFSAMMKARPGRLQRNCPSPSLVIATRENTPPMAASSSLSGESPLPKNLPSRTAVRTLVKCLPMETGRAGSALGMIW